MKEIWEEHLDEEGREDEGEAEEGRKGGAWKAERKGLDVGASPGGWTQYLRCGREGGREGGREEVRKRKDEEKREGGREGEHVPQRRRSEG